MTNERESELKNLKVNKLQKAERMILCHVQWVAFSKVKTILAVKQYKSKKTLKSLGHSVYKLNPVLKDDLLVVGGQLTRMEIMPEAKHQIILPYKSHVTDWIIEECHLNMGHMG